MKKDEEKENTKIHTEKINVNIKVYSEEEHEKVKTLSIEYKKRIEIYKKQAEEFKITQLQLQKKLNYTNDMVKELKKHISSLSNFSNQNIIPMMKKLLEYPNKQNEISKEMNKEISKKGKFIFNENMPIKSFDEGINFYEKMTFIMNKGNKNLKILINEVEKLQKEIILDNSYPIKEDKKNKIFNLMELINYNDIGKGKFIHVVKDKNCIVCLEDFKKDDIVKLFSCKKHIFHENCIKQWIESSYQCPLCKYSLKNDLVKYNLIW